MWISRKKYNEMVKELESLRTYADIFNEHLNNMIDEIDEEDLKYTENLDDVLILRRILDCDTTTKTKICRDIGISFKTLRNILEDKPVKPSTREKIRKYVYNANGSIKKEVLNEIGVTYQVQK